MEEHQFPIFTVCWFIVCLLVKRTYTYGPISRYAALAAHHDPCHHGTRASRGWRSVVTVTADGEQRKLGKGSIFTITKGNDPLHSSSTLPRHSSPTSRTPANRRVESRVPTVRRVCPNSGSRAWISLNSPINAGPPPPRFFSFLFEISFDHHFLRTTTPSPSQQRARRLGAHKGYGLAHPSHPRTHLRACV